MDQDQDQPALARLADDGNPHADEGGNEIDDRSNTPAGPPPTVWNISVTIPPMPNATGGEQLLARIVSAGPGGAEPLVVLLDALLEIGCHAVANLHPESCRDIPAGALAKAAERLPLFYPDVTRAAEIAQVWAERSSEVEAWRLRRLARGTEPPVPETPFPTSIAAAYSRKIHGNAGVFENANVHADQDGQAVVTPKAPRKRRAAAPAKRGGRTAKAPAAKVRAKKGAKRW